MALALESKEQAETILNSIIPETKRIENKRSKTIVKIKNSCILITINALDRTALKAALNSCLKAIILAKEMAFGDTENKEVN